ncbi:HMA2 domain-containing protein [Dictyobacter kobayashii]|uniref:Uncharacterized protein n=1 Tax=Dictyobacter kobayashii TaxID=2014872 RepID=A0A402AB82_9CHLR|nr:hypothetical protein [Dictyobacter kobayashii]GCE16296.1 hypothetical protein KDK_00960 [Dictyobacter kobayashii]
MSEAEMVVTEPCVVHATTGRIRVHVPGWSGQGKRYIEMQLHQVQGIQRIQANPVTGNILVLLIPPFLMNRPFYTKYKRST